MIIRNDKLSFIYKVAFSRSRLSQHRGYKTITRAMCNISMAVDDHEMTVMTCAHHYNIIISMYGAQIINELLINLVSYLYMKNSFSIG